MDTKDMSEDYQQFLMDKSSNTFIPLKTARFQVDISQGFADVILHQVYENPNDHPLEVKFAMPISYEFNLNRIEVDFTLQYGSKICLVTKVDEREKA